MKSLVWFNVRQHRKNLMIFYTVYINIWFHRYRSLFWLNIMDHLVLTGLFAGFPTLVIPNMLDLNHGFSVFHQHFRTANHLQMVPWGVVKFRAFSVTCFVAFSTSLFREYASFPFSKEVYNNPLCTVLRTFQKGFILEVLQNTSTYSSGFYDIVFLLLVYLKW